MARISGPRYLHHLETLGYAKDGVPECFLVGKKISIVNSGGKIWKAVP